MKINLDALQVVDAIDTYGTFTEAAEKLHRVQSTLSYTVQKLESDLNVKIFDRSARRVKLTAPGKILVHEGKRILQALERLEHRVKRIDAGWESEFRMVLDEMFPFTKLLPHLAAFKTSYPATQLKLSYSEPTGCALEAVLNGRADLAIESLDAPPGIDGLATAPLGRLALAFVAAPGQRPASWPDAMGHDIGVQNCIIALHPGLARLPGQPLASVQERDILYVPDIKTKLEALLNGLGAGFIPEYMARPYIESGQLIERKTRFLPMHRQYSLIWRSDDHGKALHWWLEHIKQVNIGQNHPAESANNEFHRILRSS